MQTPLPTLQETHSGVIDVQNIPVSPSFAQEIVKRRWYHDQERFILYGAIVSVVSVGCITGILVFNENCPLQNGLFSCLNFCLGSVVGLVVSHAKTNKKK